MTSLLWLGMATRVAATETARCVEGEPRSAFAAIQDEAGARNLKALRRSDDAKAHVRLPFDFPWFGSRLNEIWVETNGQVLMTRDGAVDWSTAPVNGGRDRIAVAHMDLRPGNSPEQQVLMLAKARSVVISWEHNVTQFAVHDNNNNNNKPGVNLQVELFDDGDVEIRWGKGQVVEGSTSEFSSGLESSLTEDVYPVTSATNDVFGYDGVAELLSWPEDDGVRFECGSDDEKAYIYFQRISGSAVDIQLPVGRWSSIMRGPRYALLGKVFAGPENAAYANLQWFDGFQIAAGSTTLVEVRLYNTKLHIEYRAFAPNNLTRLAKLNQKDSCRGVQVLSDTHARAVRHRGYCGVDHASISTPEFSFNVEVRRGLAHRHLDITLTHGDPSVLTGELARFWMVDVSAMGKKK